MRPEVAGVLSLTFTASTAQTDQDAFRDNQQTELTTVVAEADVELQLTLTYPPSRCMRATRASWRRKSATQYKAPATNVTAVLRFLAGSSVLLGGSCVPDGAETVCTFAMGQLPSRGWEHGHVW